MSSNKCTELDSRLATELAALLIGEGWVVKRCFDEYPQRQYDIEFAEVDGDHLRLSLKGFSEDCTDRREVFFGPSSYATVTIDGEHCWHTLRFLWLEHGDARTLTVTNPEMQRRNSAKCTEQAALKIFKIMTATNAILNIEA